MSRLIPATLATQHPDNASAPYWETDGDGFVSTEEEIEECYRAFRDLDCQEFMWDWEGKYVDEGVADKLFQDYYDYFKRVQLGKDKFLTFRIPNIWRERGYGLARAIMGILTAERFARDLGFHTPPLFEVILPMTDKAEKIIHIQKIFTELATATYKIFDESSRFRYLNVIPLIEGVDDLLQCRRILDPYVALHTRLYRRKPHYLRVHIARSDPALNSGLVAAVIAGKAALSQYYQWGADHGIAVYPALGAGSLPFRGGLAPDRISDFLGEYPGVRTAYIQSAFRYDYPLPTVKKAVARLNRELPRTAPLQYTKRELAEMARVCRMSAGYYQPTIERVAGFINRIARDVPSRRARMLHVGLFGYSRMTGKARLPRAIPFTAALYSLGVPPEFIGTGRVLRKCTDDGIDIEVYYTQLRADLMRAGKFLNKENLAYLARSGSGWRAVADDIRFIEEFLGEELGPRTKDEIRHGTLTSTALRLWREGRSVGAQIVASGKIRHSLG